MFREADDEIPLDTITPYRRSQTRRFLSSGIVALHGMTVALQSARVLDMQRVLETLQRIEHTAEEVITYLDWLLPPDPDPQEEAIRGLHDALNHLRLVVKAMEGAESDDADALLGQVEQAADSGASHANRLVELMRDEPVDADLAVTRGAAPRSGSSAPP
jgi:hypothetical protein